MLANNRAQKPAASTLSPVRAPALDAPFAGRARAVLVYALAAILVLLTLSGIAAVMLVGR
jgi:hypothetical protein